MITNLKRLLDSLSIPVKSRFLEEEVATILGTDGTAVRNLIRSGQLKAVKTSPRKWGFVLYEDLDAYIIHLNGGAL